MEYRYIGINDNENCEKLNILIEKFNNAIDVNTFLIKEKIKNKLEIIKQLRIFGFSMLNYDKETSKNIIDKLTKIDESNNIALYNDNINKILGSIIHNIYEHSGYQVLISNVPEYGIVKNTNVYEKIDSTIIYDTITQFDSDSDTDTKVLNVFQISQASYLIKFNDNDFAKYICKLLNYMLIDKNIIKVDYVGDNNISNLDSDGNNGIHNTGTNIGTAVKNNTSYMQLCINKINNAILFLLSRLAKNK